jgi:hypothetical protein
MSDILFRLRLRGQAATKAGLDSTTRSVDKLGRATTKLNLGLAVMGNESLVGNKGLTELQKTLATLPGGLTRVSGTLFALAPVLTATAGSAFALTAALAPVAGVAAAAGDGLLAAGQGLGVFALATSGLDEALKASSDPEKYAEALAALPPAARDFADALVAMKPLLDDLRQTAAAGFFPGAEKGLSLAARNFGVINEVVSVTAKVLGNLAERAGALVGSSAFGADLEKIGRNNAKVLDVLGGALLHVVSALRHVLVEAGPLTLWLAEVANGWSLNAAMAAEAGRESGRMAAFFDRTRETLTLLGSIVSHTTSGLFGLGKAGTDSGNSMWESINRLAIRFDMWANSVDGQTAIRRFFKESRDLMAALLPVLGGIVSAFALLSLRLLPVTEALRLLGPYADELTIAFVYSKLAITGLNVAATAWGAAASIAAFATGGWTAAFWRLNAAMDANVFGLVIIAVAAIAAGLYYAYTHSETFRNAVDGLWGALKDGFGWVQANWPLLLAILTGPFGLAALAIAKNWDSIVGGAKGAINAIISMFNAGFGLINTITPGKTKIAGVTIFPGIPDIQMIPALASGGVIARSGVAVMNEAGAEVVQLPTGAIVHPADSPVTKAALGGGAGSPIVVHFSAPLILDGVEIGRLVATQWGNDAAFA